MSVNFDRVAFIYHKGQLFVQEKGDTRSCEEWVKDIRGMHHEEWAAATRGYLIPGRIQFFTGEDYRPARYLGEYNVNELRDVHRRLYGADCQNIFNGVKPTGEQELWEPIQKSDCLGGWFQI